MGLIGGERVHRCGAQSSIRERLMEKTQIIWRRFGKEHGEDDEFRNNPADLVKAGLRAKAEASAQTPPDQWRWWCQDSDLLVEKPYGKNFGPDSAIHYLPRQDWIIVENIHLPRQPQWTWYVHIGKIEFSVDLNTWVFTDLFVDVLVQADGKTHTVVDLDDLGRAVQIGLIDTTATTHILQRTQTLLDLIGAGDFPPVEIEPSRKFLANLHQS
jgi:hypothetical protein